METIRMEGAGRKNGFDPRHVPEIRALKANVGCGLEKTRLRSVMVQQMAAHKGVSTR